MQLSLIKNTEPSKSVPYKIARIVFAETHAKSLRAVEALTSMIKNISVVSGLSFDQILADKNLFESLNTESKNHHYINVTPDDKKFQLCLRVANRMLHGNLPDCCYGATKFHNENNMPEWAISRGYIADIDGLLFYL